MKLRNSFLIAAGVFFFAVAFVNFAKAGDDLKTISTTTNANNVEYPTIANTLFCTSYVFWKYDPNTGKRVFLITENEWEMDWNGPIDSKEGEKSVCLPVPNGTCYSEKCSSYWSLENDYNL